MSYCQMAIDINNGLPLQKHFIAVHACSQASSESQQRTKVLIDTFTPYQSGKKAQVLGKNGTVLENPIWRTKTKNVINVCMHKFACTNVTPKRRNGAHFITHASHCAWVKSARRCRVFSPAPGWHQVHSRQGDTRPKAKVATHWERLRYLPRKDLNGHNFFQ